MAEDKKVILTIDDKYFTLVRPTNCNATKGYD